ncbi:MAG: TIGR02452 family protein [Bacilli bacterium]|nr:TIGR02452 family protein [Bacilli bacterium]
MLYVPGVKIFKKATTLPNGLEGAEMMDRSEWFDVDIIVSAAPHLHDERSFGEKKLMSVYKRRLGRVLDIAENQGIEALILGAYGCGAFRNDPHLIAKAFHELLTENEYGFAVVEFAIIYHGDSKNFDAFVKEFGNA